MTAPPSFPPRKEDTGRRLVPSAAARTTGRHGPAVAVAVIATVLLLAVWTYFVRNRTGRIVDEAALAGASFGQNRLWQLAGPVLDTISGPFIIGVLLATMLLAVLRRRLLLAVQVAIVMGGANLTTQVLKRVVLDRPDLGLGDRLVNTLPSGHTTAAASVAVALTLVVPRRLRPAAAVVGALYTAATGISTLIGRWHRPSDAAAAVLVVLVWAGVATAIGARTVAAPGAEQSGHTTVVTSVLLLGAVGTGVLAAVALRQSLEAASVGHDLTSRAELLTAYGGGALGVVAVVLASFGVLLVTLRRVESRTA